MNDSVIFSLTGNNDLVDEICQRLDTVPGKIDVKHFADGEILVELGESVRGKKVYFVQSTYKPVNERLMELLIAVDCVKRASASDIICIIPYYGYARQDRKASPRQPITAKLVADLLTAAGADRVAMFDLHASQIQGFFDFPVDDLTCVPMIGQYFFNKGLDLANTVVVSPDHGGTNRARKLADILDTPLAIVDKRRPRANVCEATSVVGDVDGKDVIIIDDMCDTGGSLAASCQILKDHGAKDIYVSLTHGVFSGEAGKKLQEAPIKEIIVSNTIPLNEEFKATNNKTTVLSVAPMLSDLISAISNHTPVSKIYAPYAVNEEQSNKLW